MGLRARMFLLVASGCAYAACDMPPASDGPREQTTASLHGDQDHDADPCEDRGSQARSDSLHRGESRDRAESCHHRAFATCRIDADNCSCEAERACRDVAWRKIEPRCDSRDSVDDFRRNVESEIAHCRAICRGESPGDLEACAAQVPVRTDIRDPHQRDIAYQRDIGSYCGPPDSSSCVSLLIAHANADYSASAAQLASGAFTPAQYLALSRDRTRKLRVAEEDHRRATVLCSSQDSDGDWVPDREDRCPNTPDLIATDDRGCPLTDLPPAPTPEAVGKVLSRINIAVSPRCKGAPLPNRIPGGAYFRPANKELGTYIFSTAVTNQPPGCPLWYQFDLEEWTVAGTAARYSVVFADREAKTDLLDLGKPVSPGVVQFNAKPTDPLVNRQQLATAGGRTNLRLRVRAMNGNGVRGPWSDWIVTDSSMCQALGFKCGDQRF